MMWMKLLAVLLVLASNVLTPVWAQSVLSSPPTRTGYWTSTGTNLRHEQSSVPFIQSDELFQAIRTGKKILFIDIREKDEYDKAHLPNARNIPFSKPLELISEFKKDAQGTLLVPYCNWDFRAYVAARNLKDNGLSNVFMMYPHGLRGWMAQGLPHAGVESGQSDSQAQSSLDALLNDPEFGTSRSLLSDRVKSQDTPKREVKLSINLFAKYTDPPHLNASVGDKIFLEIKAHDEDHWFVIPDFGIEEHLDKGQKRTVELMITRSGYFPFGCISCCTRYHCKTKQAILVDFKLPRSSYGE